MCPKISYVTFTISKVEYEIFDPTWEGAQKFMGRPDFIAMLQWFGATGKDLMNAETVELLCPYIEFPAIFLYSSNQNILKKPSKHFLQIYNVTC